ncbi:hypothetical protein CDAR_278711 [Caerostris darwini]|uniref:Uncharacterized protein n=1 Tax=Caerostris darwini TaxID=1538125 RepID=A0AAV4WPL3_9ARAC|nr:hypothetical protein CDAR_278711 [Caerostris darwini]
MHRSAVACLQMNIAFNENDDSSSRREHIQTWLTHDRCPSQIFLAITAEKRPGNGEGEMRSNSLRKRPTMNKRRGTCSPTSDASTKGLPLFSGYTPRINPNVPFEPTSCFRTPSKDLAAQSNYSDKCRVTMCAARRGLLSESTTPATNLNVNSVILAGHLAKSAI